MTDKKPFFSVIIPAHNSAEYIEKGLESIRGQSFKDYELIVVCDKCTDNTAEVVEAYKPEKLIKTEYGLDGMARNAGIDAAEGEYLLFMDDDDWFLHEYVFEQLHAAIMQEKAKGVTVDIIMFSFIWKGRGYCSQVSGHRIAVWSKCWRREHVGDTRFPAVPHWSDVDFDNAMFAKDGHIGVWDMPMYYYNYLRPGSISWRKEQGEIEGRKE